MLLCIQSMKCRPNSGSSSCCYVRKVACWPGAELPIVLQEGTNGKPRPKTCPCSCPLATSAPGSGCIIMSCTPRRRAWSRHGRPRPRPRSWETRGFAVLLGCPPLPSDSPGQKSIVLKSRLKRHQAGRLIKSGRKIHRNGIDP